MILPLIICLLAYIFAQLLVNSNKKKIEVLNPPTGNILILDTETNGLPKNWKASLNDINNWPRMVSIAWNKITPKGEILSKKYFIIKPNGFSINREASKVHGISNDFADMNGFSLESVVNEFDKEIVDCKYLVAHNIEFDYSIIFCEYHRIGIDTSLLSSLQQICTMKESTEFCKIQTRNGYKYPKLSELYKKLFSKTITESHNANTDVEVCMKCFKELYNRKIIKF